MQALIAAPSLLFLVTLTLMLFRPANVGLFPFDRIAFLLLALAVLIRILLLQQKLPVSVSFSMPMLGLAALALAGNWKQPYDAEAWSVVAAQFLVPFAMFHLARAVFTTDTAVRRLETFCLLTLAYLCFISIAFLSGQTELIFPRFILDGVVDMHVDRARGPLLQAVANGVSVNLLGLVAFDLYRRKRLTRIFASTFLLAAPIAIFATMTRSVWLSSVLSLSAIAFVSKGPRLRRFLLLVGIAAGVIVYVACAQPIAGTASQQRLQDRNTVDFRLAVYELSWDMLREKPLLGWGQGEFARETEARMSEFRPGAYAAHNTFVDIVVEHGAVGLVLYLWIAVNLFRLRKTSKWLPSIWPVCLGVYFVNACCVVMNYQFVNALLFTLAGVMAAQSRGHAEKLAVHA
jgi:O-antigen ligase